MNFGEQLKENIKDIDTIYDLIAYCYCYMLKNISNHISFLGYYIYKNDKSKSNPNLEKLELFSFQVKKFVSEGPLNLFDRDAQAPKLMDLIEDEENRLKKYRNTEENRATIPYFILKGLDLFLEDAEYVTYKKAPLNEHFREKCLVYVNEKETLMDQVAIRRNYPNLVLENKIKYSFKNIIIIDSREVPSNYGKPQVATLYKEKDELRKIIQENKIKVVVIPTIKEQWFDFCYSGGACFHVEYHMEKLEQMKKRIIKLLTDAIDSGANIIVFPEYVCKEEIQFAISDILKERSNEEPRKMSKLLLVVAGSGWTGESNNVCRIYGSDGTELGKMYKYSAYDNTDKNGNKMIEGLDKPGKEITLVKIPGVGICQIEICRDVSENSFCLCLAKTFRPQFLLISAWSSSINIGFREQLQSIAVNTHKTCAGIANCCAAIDSMRQELGIVVAPQKDGSSVTGKCKYIERDLHACEQICEKGCFFEICYDFNGDEKQDIIVTTTIRNGLK